MPLKPTSPPTNPLTGSNCELPCLLRVDQVARLLGVSERTIFSITAPRGELVAMKIGGSLRYDPADIQLYLESRKIRPE